ncbi:MAG: M61 family peptidase [Bacteroidota bacterium]|nr:M61 family peptidase [Bacteroidota bacterium]
MHYTISYTSQNTHFIDITLHLKIVNEEEIFLQLPAWRPGRYELANFAKNIQKFKVVNEKGDALPFKKNTKDSWSISTSNEKEIYVHYNYYAFQMDAGNSYLDESQLYINFINCLLYDKKRMQEKCLVKLKIPEDYLVACGLPQVEKNVFDAVDYYRLVDSPLMASKDLFHLSYEVEKYAFNIWVIGSVNTNWGWVLEKFRAFTKKQIEMMGGFPHPDYHFLFQILPYKHYHGVEHFNSTVITIGPSEKFNRDEFLNNFLGVSSHELFHTWNAIRIRPKELMPYDFSKENYFETGYVAEGFTTYYGDLFLVRSGVFEKNTYLKELNSLIYRHFDNNGRFNLSLTNSSYDLWIDGYVSGIPNRKVSIYVKGAIVALMLDLEIRTLTNFEKSLDDVIKQIWKHYGLKKHGYTSEDIKNAIEQVTGKNFDGFFHKYIFGNEPEEHKLGELLNIVGCKLVPVEGAWNENKFGFKINQQDMITKISAIQPDSNAENLLSIDDEIIALNDRKIENNLADLIENLMEAELTLFRNKKLKKIKLINSGEHYWRNYKLLQNPSATPLEKQQFEKWLECKW